MAKISKQEALGIRMVSAYNTLRQIKNEHGPQEKVKFGGLMTVNDAIKKTKAAAKRDGVKLRGK